MAPLRRFAGRRTRVLGLAAAALALLVTLPRDASARDPLYRWTDASGNVRYTTHLERIPKAFRHDARPVEAERDVPLAAAGSAAQPPVEAAPAGPGAASELDARIARLEADIERDETELEEMVSDPERSARLRESGELSAIAQRLPELQRELRELRAQREALGGSDAP